MKNIHLTFDYSTYSQKLGEDFAKFCGLLRIYELKKDFAKAMKTKLVITMYSELSIKRTGCNKRTGGKILSK